jgi:hypothetical protein
MEKRRIIGKVRRDNSNIPRMNDSEPSFGYIDQMIGKAKKKTKI